MLNLNLNTNITRILSKRITPTAARAIFHTLAGLFMGGYASFVPGINFMACGYFTGVWLAKRNYPAAFFGCLAGLIISGASSTVFTLLFMAAMLMIWTIWQGAPSIKLRDKYMIAAASVLFTVIAFHFETTTDCLYALLTSALTLVWAYITRGALMAIVAFLDRRRLLSVYEQGVLLLFIGLLTYGLGSAFDFIVSPGIIIACVAGMTLVFNDGLTGLCFALVAAFGARLNMGVLTALCLSGSVGIAMLISSLATPIGKWGTVAVFFVVALVFGEYVTGSMTLFELLIAAVIALSLPKRTTLRLCALTTDMTLNRARKPALDKLLDRLKTTAEVMNLMISQNLQHDNQTITSNLNLTGVSPSFFPQSDAGLGGKISAVHEALTRTIEQADDMSSGASLKPKLRLTTGVATEAGTLNEVCGDSVCIETDAQNRFIILSDGMGTGPSARTESDRLIQLLKRLISAGFDVCDALLWTNEMLISEYSKTFDCNANEIYATADILSFDNQTGEGVIVKQGAPPSFIMRDSRIITIYGEALPVGILEEAVPYVHNVRFEPGDKIVMLTDGISDALGGHLIATITETLTSLNPNLPRIELATLAAQNLILAALSQSTRPPDDMSAVVAFVE